jgi:SAM-dependent methyltransferase
VPTTPALWAFFNDVAQRIITLNKIEQRVNLRRRVRSLNLSAGAKALDFGCGTALFAPTMRECGLRYYGYDIDPRLIAYARRLYDGATFLSTPGALAQHAPFDLIVANCCFHHISDEALSQELPKLRDLLADRGVFLMIDLLLDPHGRSFLCRQFDRLERGSHIRREAHYRRLVESVFAVHTTAFERSHVLSLKGNPIFSDLIVFECRKRVAGRSA